MKWLVPRLVGGDTILVETVNKVSYYGVCRHFFFMCVNLLREVTQRTLKSKILVILFLYKDDSYDSH